MSARTETVISVLLSDPPPLVAPVPPRSPGRTDRKPPAWIQDPDLRASIVAGFVDLPDWGSS